VDIFANARSVVVTALIAAVRAAALAGAAALLVCACAPEEIAAADVAYKRNGITAVVHFI
jgi:hypothetical protein